MGLLQRLFSPEYRQALAAEAEGDYLTAARAFALCGEMGKVADMHLAQARNEREIAGRLRALRNALAFAPAKDTRRPMIMRMLARALQERARDQGSGTEEGQRDLLEAAVLLERSESWEAAGDLYRTLGDRDRAAHAYTQGGLLAQVEGVLADQERDERRSRTLEQSYRDYELLLCGGQRDEAAAALRECVEAAQSKGDYRRLLRDLERRLLTARQVPLRIDDRQLLLLGRFPVVLGRDADCDLVLRGPSVSRRHARIDWDEADQSFRLSDLNSRNNTLLDGIAVGGSVPLPLETVIGLGDSSQVEAVTLAEMPQLLHLTVRVGVDRDKVAVVAAGPVALARLGGPPATIEFSRNRPLLGAAAGTALTLGDARVGGPIQLIRGDRVHVGGQLLEVPE